ncbi:hypothetical protein [Nostoc sp. GT001]|uniref:hypothetical protein n=1 Tax=Nostoc sp. GT001 TaxID=3056647 RepID=UPI0025AA7CFD|nr:hypothetical protein [Nostoc sp. GT001]MDM9583142.1 hypothetical protein [Nostoc sp. GT001]
MHPRELRTKYNLSLTQLAFYLTCDRRTAERYCSNEYHPRQIIFLACWLLDAHWQQVGRVIPPDFLVPTI